LRAIADLLHEPKSVKLVRFVLFDERTYKAYAAAAEKLGRDFLTTRSRQTQVLHEKKKPDRRQLEDAQNTGTGPRVCFVADASSLGAQPR